MTVQVCSLITTLPQVIPNDGQYHVLRFPFGTDESSDATHMHQMTQPDGYVITDWTVDDRSGLIWPSADGWGSLTAVIYWSSGNYTEIRDRFIRDPFNLTTGLDSTATEDHTPTLGGQFRHKSHELFTHINTPLSVAVKHNGIGEVSVDFAEFKLAIHT